VSILLLFLLVTEKLEKTQNHVFFWGGGGDINQNLLGFKNISDMVIPVVSLTDRARRVGGTATYSA
jgi:hypothetical protein